MSETNQAPVSLTFDQLMVLMKEIKKPEPPSEAEEKKLQQEQNARKQQAELHTDIAENKKRQQKTCTHLRRDGTSRGVYVKNGNYILCQKCQVIIRPEGGNQKSHVNSIYDTNLFNRLFQMSVISNVTD